MTRLYWLSLRWYLKVSAFQLFVNSLIRFLFQLSFFLCRSEQVSMRQDGSISEATFVVNYLAPILHATLKSDTRFSPHLWVDLAMLPGMQWHVHVFLIWYLIFSCMHHTFSPNTSSEVQKHQGLKPDRPDIVVKHGTARCCTEKSLICLRKTLNGKQIGSPPPCKVRQGLLRRWVWGRSTSRSCIPMLLACDLLWSREVFSSCRKLDRSWFPPWSRWSLRSLLRSLYSSLLWYAYNFFADGTYDVFYSVTDSQLVGCRSIWKVALENLIIGSVYGATKISRMQKNDWSNRRLVCWQCMSTAHITWIFSIFLSYLEINRAHVLRIHSKSRSRHHTRLKWNMGSPQLILRRMCAQWGSHQVEWKCPNPLNETDSCEWTKHQQHALEFS